MEIVRICPICKKKSIVQLAPSEERSFQKYIAGMLLIQDAFPEMDPEKRETLMSGFCQDCQTNIFECGDENDELI